MITRNLKTIFRDIRKNKLFSTINISGLAVGMACAMLIFLWVNFELSHDDFHLNKNNIYKVSHKDDSYTVPGPLAPYLKNEFSEIIEATRYLHRANCKLILNNKGYFADGSYVDQSFFTIFSFPLIKGNPKTLLTTPNSIVITQQLAKRIFGKNDPLGKVIQLNDSYLKKTEPMVVTGLMEDIPANTHLKVEGENKFEFLIPIKLAPQWIQSTWRYNMLETYVLLIKGADVKNLNQKIAGIIKEHHPKETRTLSLVSLKTCYLYNLNGDGRIQNIYLFSFVALFILIIAGINFINLSTVRSEQWARQIAIKKVLGASKGSLIRQFLVESIIFAYVAMVAAALLTSVALPTFNRLFGSSMQIQFFSVQMILMILLPLFIGLLAGIYPAFVLSSHRPIKILGTASRGNNKKLSGTLRNGLTIFQFSLSIILVIFGLLIYLQNQHLSKQNLGYEKDNILVVKMRGGLKKSFNIVKEQLLQIPQVKGVSSSNNPITHRWWTTDDLTWEGQIPGQILNMGMDMVGYDFDKTMGIQMVRGRFLSRDFSTDAREGVVINEEAVKKMNLKNPIGKIIKNLNERDYKIIGVMKNFHVESLHQQIKPHLYIYGRDAGNFMYVKLSPGRTGMSELINRLRKQVQIIVPTDPFSFTFLDSALTRLYKSEKITQTLINFSTLITMIMSCLGLIGLGFYTTRQRIKEICIRKVLGGSVTGLIIYLNKNIVKWVVIANIFAWPIAWMIANNWLQNFAYRVNVSLWVFLFAGVFTVAIALLAVSYQTIKGANINPAECLRRE